MTILDPASIIAPFIQAHPEWGKPCGQRFLGNIVLQNQDLDWADTSFEDCLPLVRRLRVVPRDNHCMWFGSCDGHLPFYKLLSQHPLALRELRLHQVNRGSCYRYIRKFVKNMPIEVLHFKNGSPSGKTLASWASRLPHLKKIHFEGLMRKSALRALRHFPGLKELDLCKIAFSDRANSPLKGSDLSYLRPLKNLKVLNLSHNKELKGSFLRQLHPLRRLEELDLSETGACPLQVVDELLASQKWLPTRCFQTLTPKRVFPCVHSLKMAPAREPGGYKDFWRNLTFSNDHRALSKLAHSRKLQSLSYYGAHRETSCVRDKIRLSIAGIKDRSGLIQVSRLRDLTIADEEKGPEVFLGHHLRLVLNCYANRMAQLHISHIRDLALHVHEVSDYLAREVDVHTYCTFTWETLRIDGQCSYGGALVWEELLRVHGHGFEPRDDKGRGVWSQKEHPLFYEAKKPVTLFVDLATFCRLAKQSPVPIFDLFKTGSYSSVLQSVTDRVRTDLQTMQSTFDGPWPLYGRFLSASPKPVERRMGDILYCYAPNHGLYILDVANASSG